MYAGHSGRTPAAAREQIPADCGLAADLWSVGGQLALGLFRQGEDFLRAFPQQNAVAGQRALLPRSRNGFPNSRSSSISRLDSETGKYAGFPLPE